MSVRKRIWKGPRGEPREKWVVDYRDQHGDRHLKTFERKRDAEVHHTVVSTAVRAGTHTADSKSITVAKAAELWLVSCDAAGFECPTITAYREHVTLRIVPVLGTLRLSQLSVPLVRGFEDRLAADRRPPVMDARPATCSARSLLTPRSAASWRRTSCAACEPPGAAKTSASNGAVRAS